MSSNKDPRKEKIKSLIRTIPDYPAKGIQFRDISTLMADKEGLALVADLFYEQYKDAKIDLVVGIEARGFILGALLAYRIGAGFVMVRKEGKMPVGNGVETIKESYQMEYRSATTIEMHTDSVKPGQRVIIIDDLLATGGTLLAAAKLVERLGGTIVELSCIVELPDLGGRSKLAGYPLYHMVEFEGD
ncbi:hypothetical protein FDP41_001355 [Naegleria fowleri]|uniref:adenine phosphoribosyltransferase n=1 Tax=Naegleria fowleri TaxID=5763 RepID=A0A6A5BR97_NAEFO|nr:uncharacterized protein FDP41_001355 [Naegleria fowleri]KAF0979687.1 hypothetical protein FDP41_001355 [Naegleria fowleri]CAG4711177.1 unnamed protein product [Naegleria fowleri]